MFEQQEKQPQKPFTLSIFKFAYVLVYFCVHNSI